MSDNYFVLVRKKKKEELLAFLELMAESDLTLEQILAQFSFKTGLRVELLKTYYQELKDANMIKKE